MEEKERYKLFEKNDIIDTEYCSTDAPCSLMSRYQACVRLNQQDKRIKELKEQLKNYKLCRCVDCHTEYEKGLETFIDELEKENQQLKQQLSESKEENKKLVKALNGEFFINYKVPMENAKLKQQLHDLPKKIVEDIRKELKFVLSDFQCIFDIDKLVDKILKKYGGENE